jgi:hypothetical protein
MKARLTYRTWSDRLAVYLHKGEGHVFRTALSYGVCMCPSGEEGGVRARESSSPYLRPPDSLKLKSCDSLLPQLGKLDLAQAWQGTCISSAPISNSKRRCLQLWWPAISRGSLPALWWASRVSIRRAEIMTPGALCRGRGAMLVGVDA